MKTLWYLSAVALLVACFAAAFEFGRKIGRDEIGREFRTAAADLQRTAWCDGVFWGWTVGRTGSNHGQLLARAWWMKEVAAKDPNAKPTNEAHQKMMKQGEAVRALRLLSYDEDPAAP